MSPGLASAAFRALSSSRGPERFAQMTPTLYRGALPTAAQLTMLRDLGVKTVVSFDDDAAALRSESESAAALGLKVQSYPFNGLEAPDPALLHRIVDALRGLDAPVYIHCRIGRDRTSLVAALYRVWVQGWNPAVAWQREARDFGHGRLLSLFVFRKLDRTYRQLTHATPATIAVPAPVPTATRAG